MKLSTGPVTTKEALQFADVLEQAIGEIVNGRMKLGKLPLEPICRVIQYIRQVGIITGDCPSANRDDAEDASNGRGVERLRQLPK